MASSALLKEWRSKEIWRRALFVRVGLIWLFRDEFTDLELDSDKLRSLHSVLTEAYRIAKTVAKNEGTDEVAFIDALERVRLEIDRRISGDGEDAELQELMSLVDKARCSDPLQLIFERLACWTRGVYGSSPCRMTALPCRTTVLDRDWLISHPYGESRPGDYHDPYHVNAQTRVAGDTARVELQVHLDGFDVRSLLAVPALLTHELVCHAHAREDTNNDRSIWAEGVMDWVAVFFFEQWATRVSLPYGLTEDHGIRLWESRPSKPRTTGRLAAAALVAWLVTDRSVRSVEVAKNVAARLALEANVVDTPLLAKDEFASKMLLIRKNRALQDAVRGWLHAGQPVAGLLT